MSRFFFATVLLMGVAASAGAQGSDAVYARAQTLVSEGQGAQGRALIDSMYRLSAPSSGERAEALYWRGSLAATAAEAERDYRAIVVDHATSPRVEDALLRLAQLELARGDREASLRHLQRLAAEFPNSRHRARTGYWTARVLFDRSDVPAACAANADALARVNPADIELKNQIEYQQQRCRAVVVASTPAGVQATTTPPLAAPSTPRDVRPSIPLDTLVRAPVTAPATAPATTPVTAPSSAPASRARSYSVQVAATNTRAGAQVIVNRMVARGYQARIDGTSAPFRVRVGQFATLAAANRALSAMKAKGQDGFVATIDSR